MIPDLARPWRVGRAVPARDAHALPQAPRKDPGCPSSVAPSPVTQGATPGSLSFQGRMLAPPARYRVSSAGSDLTGSPAGPSLEPTGSVHHDLRSRHGWPARMADASRAPGAGTAGRCPSAAPFALPGLRSARSGLGVLASAPDDAVVRGRVRHAGHDPERQRRARRDDDGRRGGSWSSPTAVDKDTFRAGQPRVWSEVRVMPTPFRSFDLHPDGRRFALLKAPEEWPESGRNHVTLVFNFAEELRRMAVPASP